MGLHASLMHQFVSAKRLFTHLSEFNDDHTKMFQSIEFFKAFTAARQRVTCVRNAKRTGGHRLHFREKAG